MDLLVPLLALAAGLLAGWLAARARAAREAAAAAERVRQTELELSAERARREAGEAQLAQQQGFLAEARKQLEDAFARVARDALHKNSEQFAALSAQRVEPLREALKGMEERTQALERARAQAYGSLEKQLAELSQATTALRTRSERLESALRGSTTARGRWGELTLRNVVEAAGMARHCDFVEQEVGDERRRPDMIVRLPEGGTIPVDAKTPLDSYWLAAEAKDADERVGHMRAHAALVRRHVRELARKGYAEGVPGRVDYVVLFLPGEPFLSAAFEHDPELLDEALKLRVLVATPVTLLALLRSAALIWSQRDIEENAREIAAQASLLHQRLSKFAGDLERIGRALAGAGKAYNDAVGSWQARVLPAGRKLEELGATRAGGKELPELGGVESELRELPSAPEG